MLTFQHRRGEYSANQHGVIFLLYWVWFLNSFLGRSSGCNFPLASYMDNIFTSPIRLAASFTLTAEHIIPCIMKSYVLGETAPPDCKLEAGAGLCRSAVGDVKQVLSICSVTCILIGFKPTTFSFHEALLCESRRSFTHALILCFIDSFIHSWYIRHQTLVLFIRDPAPNAVSGDECVFQNWISEWMAWVLLTVDMILIQITGERSEGKWN